MKLNWKLFGMFIILALTACSNRNETLAGRPEASPPSVAPTLLASGGSSTSGTGGGGGSVYAVSYGAVKVLKSGTVDAVFTVPTYTPDFGTNHAVVSAGTTTTVLLDADDSSGNLCAISWNTDLYIGNGDKICDGGDTLVTGLTVEAGATLVLVDQGSGYATLRLANDLVIFGTLTTEVDLNWGIDIEANVIDVESGGKIVTSATTTDMSAGEIWLGSYMGTTQQIINHGTIEAKGLGNGGGGWIVLESADLVVNTGTIDASGGDSTVFGSSGGRGGSGGELDVYVDYGDFYSSGIIRMNGGKGATDGGDSEADFQIYNWYSVYVETAYVDNIRGRNGDIIISGTYEANGGDGTNGSGGYGGYIYLQTNALGAVTINATMSVKGGEALAAGFSGGNAWYGYGIDIYSYLDPYFSGGFADPTTPGKIRIAGTYDLRGGNGDGMGGFGGIFNIYSNGYNASNIGSDVELVGFPAIDLNGGEGASGGSAAAGAFRLYTSAVGATLAGPITNEARIEARGGKATGTGTPGGAGGYVELLASGPSGSTTVINNSGDIDISGGTGDTGGAAYGAGAGDALHLQAVHVTNSGALTAKGGNGTIFGGNGGNITLNSTDSATLPTTNTGTLNATGGTGTAAGTPGTRTIDGTVL